MAPHFFGVANVLGSCHASPMRLPSLSRAFEQARTAAARFPFVIATAVTAATLAVCAAQHDPNVEVINGVIASQLGIPALIALAVAGERLRWSRALVIGSQVAMIGVLTGYYFSLPPWLAPSTGIRLVQFNLAAHLAVAFLPYVNTSATNGFWQFNKTLFLRLLTSVIHSAVLFAGLAGALFAIDQLLGIDVSDMAYPRLFFIIAFVYNTWFFLGGIPNDYDALEKSTDYPHPLKVFSQYILVPIVIVYLIILTVYLGKVVISREWPSGLIGPLVSWVATAGILSLLLVHPIRDTESWIATFSRWFYVGIFPAIIMLGMAVGKRITQYAITEPRYFLSVLTVWLGAIALYFTFSRNKNIKVIPMTLCIVALATSFGPWGAYATSQRSQTNRLAGYLQDNGMLSDGVAHPLAAPATLDDDAKREIREVLRYLINNHGTGSIEPWFRGNLAEIDTIGTSQETANYRKSRQRVDLIASWLNVGEPGVATSPGSHFTFTSLPHGHSYDVSSFDLFYRFELSADQKETTVEGVTVRMNPDAGEIEVTNTDGSTTQFPVAPLVRRLDSDAGSRQHELAPTEMQLEPANANSGVSIYLHHINGTRTQNGVELTFLTGDLLVRLPD